MLEDAFDIRVLPRGKRNTGMSPDDFLIRPKFTPSNASGWQTLDVPEVAGLHGAQEGALTGHGDDTSNVSVGSSTVLLMATKEDEPSRTAELLTTYRTVIVGLLIVGAGLLALWATSVADWLQGRSGLQALVEQLAGLLITTGGLALLWDLRGKRDIMREVFAKVGLQADVQAAGLQRASMDWRVVPWTELIQGARQIDVFIAYGSTWLSTNHTDLVAFAKKRGNKLRYILPDPEDDVAMTVLAERFDYTTDIIKGKVYEAARGVAKLARDGNADVRVRFRKGAPTFTCYRFDNKIVVTLYQHKVGRGEVPTFVIDSGTFKSFFEGDLQGIVAQAREVGIKELLGEDKDGKP